MRMRVSEKNARRMCSASAFSCTDLYASLLRADEVDALSIILALPAHAILAK